MTLTSPFQRHEGSKNMNRDKWSFPGLLNDTSEHIRFFTVCPKKVSPLNILQQPPQTYLNEILHTQDDIYFCHRRQIS